MEVCSYEESFNNACHSFEELKTIAECFGITDDADDLSASDETPSLGDYWDEHVAIIDSENSDLPTSDFHTSDKMYFGCRAAPPAPRARPRRG